MADNPFAKYTVNPFAKYATEEPSTYESRVASIPGATAQAPAATPRRSWQDVALGVAETPIALASGIAGGVVQPVAGIVGELTSRAKQGSPEANAAGQRAMAAVQRGLYQPQSQTGQDIMGGVGEVTNQLLPAVPVLNTLPRAMPNVREAVNYNAPAPIRAAQARAQAVNVERSYANAPLLDATQTAVKHNLVVDPAITNPTAKNRLLGAAAGTDLQTAAGKQNAARVTDLVRKDLGVNPTEKLTQASVETALDKADAPNGAVRKLGRMTASTDIYDQINGLRSGEIMGAEGAADAVNGVLDHAQTLLGEGRTGAQLLDDIRQLRKQAQSTYKARDAGTSPPPPSEIASADARMGLAKTLENMIDENVKDPQVIADLKAGRVRQAQIFDHDRSINYANHTVDPQAYARMLDERKGNMTGVGADIGQVAAQFPDVMKTVAPKGSALPQITRGGFGGTLGYGAGLLTGIPGAAYAGAATGALTGALGGKLAAKRMVSPAYQARNALAQDFRPAPEPQLTPAEINYGPNQLVPFDPRNAVVGAAPAGPNFTFGRSDPNVMPDMPSGPAQLGAPSAASTLNTLAQDRARAAGMSRTLGQQAEAQQAAAEAATRAPTGRGQPLQFDAAGNLVPPTPAPTGTLARSSLATAVDKLSSPQLFDMTATEKVAWGKAKANLDIAAPELKGMSDSQIAGKIMDREWATEAVKKAQEKAQAFDKIAQESKSAQERFNAGKARDQMLNALDDLQESMLRDRPTRSGAQGPKTREAIRNKMTPAPTNRLILE